MLSEWNLLEKSIENVQIVIKHLIIKDLKIKNTYSITADSFLFIRSGSIDTPTKALQFSETIKKISQVKPLRVLSCQVNNPEHEWEIIHSQHCRLAVLNQKLGSQGSIAHLVVPLFPFFIDTSTLPSEFAAKAITRLYKQINTEGWITLSRWLNEEMEAILKSFKPEALDEYQLQARLEDFGIETHSLFLNSVEEELQSTLLSMDRIEWGHASESEVGTLFSLEKKAIALRERLKTALQIKYTLLNDIVIGIGIIEKAHPDLLSLKLKAFLLALLLGQEIGAVETSTLTSEQQLLLLQLLNQQLGVITAINCDTGLERTSIAISLMLSMAELSTQIPIDRLISMILNWSQEKSSEADRLRQCIAFNLEHLSWPILMQSPERKTGLVLSKAMQENQVLLSYLPSHLHSLELMTRMAGY